MLVFHQSAGEPEVVTGCGEDAVLAFGIPTGDAVLEFGRAVEMDFLGTLDGPVLEDAVATRGGVALDCVNRVGPRLFKFIDEQRR